jgi:hypothetical protein
MVHDARQKRTPWFPGKVKPARPGVYERMFESGHSYFALWTGRKWMVSYFSPARAAAEDMPSPLQEAASWRGLTQQAAEQAAEGRT